MWSENMRIQQLKSEAHADAEELVKKLRDTERQEESCGDESQNRTGLSIRTTCGVLKDEGMRHIQH